MDAKLIFNETTGKFESDKQARGAANSFVRETGAATLTDKTLTAPTITAPIITGTSTIGAGLTVTSPSIVTPTGVAVALEAAFTQTAANATHTATFEVPAGATIIDIIITSVAVWDSDTSTVLKMGIGDDDCFFTGLDLKTIPGAGKSINFSHPGDAEGASIPKIDGGVGATQLGATNGFLYKATAQSVVAVVTDTNVSGVAGRTRVTLIYTLPQAVTPVVT